LVDHSPRTLRGIVEDALIKLDDFIFPMDFIILKTKFVTNPKAQIPVILGRHFHTI